MSPWIHTHTFHATDFSADDVCRLRDEKGSTVSVILPTRNVASTVGQICSALRSAWMDGPHHLIDELVVVDAASTDGSAQIAAASGARVVQESEIRPDIDGRGKGAAMWRGLIATTGDIVAWIDSDIVDFRPSMLAGLVGPLLAHEDLEYVKGFGDRVLEGSTVGGGRVSEIAARPLINRFRPELAGLIHPLSGEAAGRRRALERMPFFTGYAVEIGLLWDIHSAFGANAIAQVDVGARRHTNQPTAELSVMASQILHAVLVREGVDERSILRLQRPRRDGSAYEIAVTETAVEELPPVVTL